MDKKNLVIQISNYLDNKEIINQKDFINYIKDIWVEVKDKKKKEPTAYNLFVKEQMEIIKRDDPTKKDKMKYIIKLWNDKKEKNRKTPRKLLN
jgi:hypothetical protein